VFLLLGSFLASLAFGVTFGAHQGSRIMAACMRVFFGLLVGAISAFCFAYGIQEIRGAQGLPKAPRALIAFCPACGAETDSTALFCSRCRLPLLGRADEWKRAGLGLLTRLLALGLGGGLSSLGLGFLIGPAVEGERRLWAMIAFVAFGLFLAAVGGLIVLGTTTGFWNEIRGIRDWEYRRVSSEPMYAITVQAFATLARGTLVSGRGTVRSVRGIDPASAPPFSASCESDIRVFVRCVALGYLAGLVELTSVRTESWRREPGTRPSRVDQRVFESGGGAADVGNPAAVGGSVTGGSEGIVRALEQAVFCELVAGRVPESSLVVPLEHLAKLVPGAASGPTALRELWTGWRTQPGADLVLRRTAAQLAKLESLDADALAQVEVALAAELPPDTSSVSS
jgi:hypothetical protein